MFQIAKRYPEEVSYFDSKGYLERAFQKAKAYISYPYHGKNFLEIAHKNNMLVNAFHFDFPGLGRIDKFQDNRIWNYSEK